MGPGEFERQDRTTGAPAFAEFGVRITDADSHLSQSDANSDLSESDANAHLGKSDRIRQPDANRHPGIPGP